MAARNRVRTVFALAVLATAISPMPATLQAALTDVFSVNFYAYNGNPVPAENVTLEAEQSAGVGNWETTGWENYPVPWNPGSPQEPVTITSVEGATATLTLEDVRNGGGSQTKEGVRTLPDGDDDGDLMDAAAWGTEDPYDRTKIFDMTVSDIPFEVYDVILYLGYHPTVGGDGTGKIVFNGTERDFTTELFTDTFTEIVDSGTPGNYIVYEGQTGSSFSVQVWGNDYNHLGVCGFQFRQGKTDPNAPDVDAGVDMVSWSGEPVQLDPNVVEQPGSDWTNLTYLWSAEPADGVEFSDPNTLAPMVTITKATENPSVVTLMLAVNNEGNPPEEAVADTMKIHVYDDACIAAVDLGLTELSASDIDGDCITDFVDFALLAARWLDDYTLTEPVPK